MTDSNFADSQDAEPDQPTDDEIAQMLASSPKVRAGVEAMVLAKCSPRWQKVAKIVGTLMNEFEQTYPHLPFAMLQATMEKLEEIGKVEINGDPWAMRHAEIRLAGPKSSGMHEA